jgi:hypothetical protein
VRGKRCLFSGVFIGVCTFFKVLESGGKKSQLFSPKIHLSLHLLSAIEQSDDRGVEQTRSIKDRWVGFIALIRINVGLGILPEGDQMF